LYGVNGVPPPCQIALLSRTVEDLKEQLASEEERFEVVELQKDEEIADRDAEVFALKVAGIRFKARSSLLSKPSL
jgi:hypothetical protein